MFLQEPDTNPYDLQFQVFGFPIRVSWTFWVAAIVIGYDLAMGLDIYLGEQSLGVLTLLAIWGVCILISITIHELGHALAFRKYGIESRIVLYFMGGMAIPTRSVGVREGLEPKQAMWVAIAGPMAQLASAIALVLLISAASYAAPVPWPLNQLKLFEKMADGRPIDSVGLLAVAMMYIRPSIYWAILNLIPVWPLDGGRFIQALIQLFGGTVLTAMKVGVAASALVAVFAFQNKQEFLAFMFLILGWNNFQAWKQLEQRY